MPRFFGLPATLVLFLSLLSLASKASCSEEAVPQKLPAFELKDGDCVALIGSTFIERERYEGYIEAQLTLRYRGKKLRFRNLGWAGDTVAIQGRPLNFGELNQHLEKVQPTVAFVCYGMNEAFEGPKGISDFVAGYERILDTLVAANVRSLVLLAPNPHEKKGPPLPDPESHNAYLKLYTEAVRQLAEKRGLSFVDLFSELLACPDWGRLTDNGIHLNASGYQEAARIIDHALHPDTQIAIASKADGMTLEGYEDLRRIIIEKNQFFFYRWRAHNGEYIYGRRAKSSGDGYGQGNAGNDQFPAEMAEFERLIAERENSIAELARR